MIRTARPYVLAVTLLATIFTATVIWASTPPSPAAATPANILGKDGQLRLFGLRHAGAFISEHGVKGGGGGQKVRHCQWD